VAEVLAGDAARAAERAGEAQVLNAARALAARVEEAPRVRVAGAATADLAAVANPRWRDVGRAEDELVFAVAARAEVRARARLGSATWSAGLRVDQRVFLQDRSALADVEWAGLELATALSLPLSDDLRAAVLDFGLRAVEVRADGLRRHLATGVEGGPSLRMSIAPTWWVELGVYGVWTNFPEASGATFERDRVGQRARVAFVHRSGPLLARLELTGINDETEGQAFDALGGAVGAEGRLAVGSRLELGGGLRVAVRRWGPIGDEAVIGRAARRDEVRLSAELWAAYRVAGPLHLVAGQDLVRVDARRPHAYVAHLSRGGLEVRW
jgi:hypothetical protein